MESSVAATVTIDSALSDFLDIQRGKLTARTFRKYEEVIELFKHSLNGYAYSALDDRERQMLEEACESGDEGAFCRVFGPEKITENLGEFLGYFMIRKVFASKDLLRASGTVTKKLAKWLHEQGYIDAEDREHATELASNAARDLPRAEKLAELLFRRAESVPVSSVEEIDDDDIVEDFLVISHAEPGEIWFTGGIGPVQVSREASELARPGWSVNIVLARAGEAWSILEVGNVYPS